ncbi:MAG: SPFH domain-containing protein, partial [Alphaproteobacteria bacterium]|nr:SPFH domain-containing protein [Alphaproteobacteria bacterium]
MSRRTLAILGILVAVVGITAFGALYTVHQTQQALVMQFGKVQSVVTMPGLKVKIPFIQDVIFVDKRILAYDAPAEEIIASDQKRLVVDSFLRF